MSFDNHFVEQGEEAQQRLMDAQILKARRSLEKRELEPSGTCYFCRDKVEGQKLFCDRDCATDYERAKKNIRL